MTYHSKSPQAAEAVVRAIVDSYIDFVEKTHKDVSVELVELLERRTQGNGRNTLNAEADELLAIKTRAGVVVREGAEIVHPLVQRVIELNKTLVEVQKNRLQLDATLTAIRTAIRERRRFARAPDRRRAAGGPGDAHECAGTQPAICGNRRPDRTPTAG